MCQTDSARELDIKGSGIKGSEMRKMNTGNEKGIIVSRDAQNLSLYCQSLGSMLQYTHYSRELKIGTTGHAPCEEELLFGKHLTR